MQITLAEAVLKLKNHEVVGLPTETVYGLAGRIDSAGAIEKIFSTKQRPFFDPLIVHVKDISQAKSLVLSWPEICDSLARKFWPGPLTLVLPKAPVVSDMISSGLETVALRIPNHPLFVEAIEKVGSPLAAPSANRFGRTSPSQGSHVESEFSGQVPWVDGGPCEVGIESTILKVENHSLQILRQGMISAQLIEDRLTQNQINFSWINPRSSKAEIGEMQLHQRSSTESQGPGAMEHHYMPDIPLVLISKLKRDQAGIAQNWSKFLPQEFQRIKKWVPLMLPSAPELAARALYSIK